MKTIDSTIARRMSAVLLLGHGGLDRLDYRQDIPVPGAGEVLIRVLAAGVNNTDINTRIGWYSKRGGGAGRADEIDENDATWSGVAMAFPRIQGADCCGEIVAVGEGIDSARIGERVIVSTMLRSYVGDHPFRCWTFGSECDGAFAQYAKAPSGETHAVACDWTDAELASIPCAWSTAENMLHRACVVEERVLISGASGSVGSAAVQLAKRRGAHVTAIARPSKASRVRAIGADEVIEREVDPVEAIGTGAIDVVMDLVGGASWPGLLNVLRAGGRYVTAGAIAGPLVELDLRTLYLRDLTLIGCTWQDEDVFTSLVSYVERGEIRPVVAKTLPLSEIAQAQELLVGGDLFGKLVLIPPG